MKSFARVTKLSNIGGRADYITNEKKQEAILAKSEVVDWKPYQDFERANQRTATANNEGREMIIALPNEWSQLPPAELHARANTIAQTAVGKATDLQWAVHWNHARSNLHIHVIFSERQREKDAGRWDRDIYLTEDGKVARRRPGAAGTHGAAGWPGQRMVEKAFAYLWNQRRAINFLRGGRCQLQRKQLISVGLWTQRKSRSLRLFWNFVFTFCDNLIIWTRFCIHCLRR